MSDRNGRSAGPWGADSTRAGDGSEGDAPLGRKHFTDPMPSRIGHVA